MCLVLLVGHIKNAYPLRFMLTTELQYVKANFKWRLWFCQRHVYGKEGCLEESSITLNSKLTSEIVVIKI